MRPCAAAAAAAAAAGDARHRAAAAGGARHSAAAALLAMALAAQLAGATPSYWNTRVGSACDHPANGSSLTGHEGPIQPGIATWTVSDASTKAVAGHACLGATYDVKLDIPKVSARNCQAFVTASVGTFAKEGEAANDVIATCPSGGAKRATSFAATSFTTKLRVACNESAASLQLQATYTVQGISFRYVTTTLPINQSCQSYTCLPPPPPPPPLASCSTPCACAFGAALGESSCGTANVTLDVRDLQALLNASTPDFAGALALYSSGRHASAPGDGGARLSMSEIATTVRGDLAYYRAAANRLGSATFLDSYLGAALRGDGAYAGACCGVRAEVAKAAARWLAAAYGWFQLDSGVCSVTGCNGQPVNASVAGSAVGTALAAVAGADSGAAPVSSPSTPFQATNEAARFLCTAKKTDALDPINKVTLSAWSAALAAARVGNATALASNYATLEAAFVVRFLQWSLREAVEAAKSVSRKELAATSECYRNCTRESRLAAARVYWKAIEPVVARIAPSVPAQVSTALAGPAPIKTLRALATQYKSVLKTLQMDARKVLSKCKA